MIIDYTNSVANYKRFQARDIRKTIANMSDEQKQHALEQITLHHGACVLMGQTFNQSTLEYVESLLNGKQPKNGLH